MVDHALALMMAEMCMEKATHHELRALCEELIAGPRAEIEEMQVWLQDWYGVVYEPEMESSRQLEKLIRREGAEFKIVFMEMKIKHHEKAVKEAEQCLDQANHPELQTLCRNIIETQSAEIA